MPAALLQTLPSARLLAAVLVAAASLLHVGGVLPARWWSHASVLALPVLLLAGMAAARRRRAAVSALIRTVIAVAAVCPPVLWQVHDGLGRRLPAALEGLDLQVTGVVDAMPQRFDFGDRVRFTLSSCRVAGPKGASPGLESESGTGGHCGGVERLQLDWGPPRARDRPDAPAAGNEAVADEAGTEGEGTDQDEAGQGPRLGARPSTAGRPDDIWPEPGQHWQLTVRLKRPVAAANPAGFDLELRYLQQGVGAIGRVHARQRLAAAPQVLAWQRPGLAILVLFESLRARLRDQLETVYAQRVDPHAAGGGRWPLLGVVAGLALGDQGAIGAGLWSLFSRTGVSHLMAISGMHVTMLALVAAWIAGRLLKILAARRIPVLSRLLGGRPRQVLVLVVAVVAAFGYALLSGWGIPSQRTCWMLTAAAVTSLTGRGRGALDVTLLAAAVVVLVDPWAPSTAGFWLSFGAVAAILWCAHVQEGRPAPPPSAAAAGGRRLPSAVRDAVTGQWAATIGLAPLVIALFSILSLIGPLANAVAIPWVSFLVTPLAVAAVLLAPLSEPAGALLLQVDLWMIDHLISGLKMLDKLPAASIAIAKPAAGTLLAAMIGAALAIAPPGVPMRRAGLLCLLPMLSTPAQLTPPDELWITVLDIGQGSSILVETADDRLLFDTGSGSGPERSAASRHLVPYLRSRGLGSIDTLVVSHLDAEHAGGAGAVLQELRPRRLLTAFEAGLLPAEPAALAATSRLKCAAGLRLRLGDAAIDVLHPTTIAGSRSAARGNAASCVVRIASPAGSVLLPGDLPASAEAALTSAAAGGSQAGNAEASRLKSDVLIVPQQGGRQATGAALLAAVQPAYAVLQVAYRNQHRHPHPAVLARLAAAGAIVLRTDQDGAVQIRLKAGAPPAVRRLRRDDAPYWRVETAVTAPSIPRR